ncbi:MAG TPA: AAA family ATPase [Candidatus Limnocylindrales bacterium]|nr:AAA family ATPase [Candidatus Limnocylindrales bacterium]
MRASRSLVCPILVGRDDLLDLADRRIGEVATGRGQLLLLAGEAGVGKTRLLGAIERKAVAAGFASMRGGTYPSDLQVAAAILIDLSRAMARQPGMEELGKALGDRLEDRGRASGDAHRRRRLLVLDVAELLAGIPRDGPAIVALEDLHWSDDLTLEILEALARQLADRPLLVVGTYRSDELFPRVPMRSWRSRLLAQRQAEEVRLARLTPDDTAMMATLLIETGLPVARDVAEAVHARTDGIPLHIEELLGVLAESGAGGAGAVREADVPDTVEDAILTRMEPCSVPAKEVAAAGAVIGRAFDLDLLSAVLDAPLDRLSAPLEELADHFVLLPAQSPWRYGFRHALICDAIYDHIPLADRRRLHGRTADAAVGTDVGTDAFLALHYERAGRRAEAHAAALRGAANASKISSHSEARELYACAIRTAPADLAPTERGSLFERFATSAAAIDDNEAADVAFRDARTAYLDGGDTLGAAAVVGPHVAVRHLLGEGLEARADALRSALAEIAAPPSVHGAPSDPTSDRVRARLLSGLAAAYMLDRRLDEAIGYALDARELAGRAGDASTDRNAATTLGACLIFAGRMDEGWSLVEDVIATSRAEHLEAEAARGYRMIGSCASVVVEYERAETWLREGIDYAERVELWNHRHYMAAHLAHVLWAMGDWIAAEEVARHALADGRGGITTRITALHVLGYLGLGRGDWPAAEGALDEARRLGEQMAELQRLSPALWGLAEMARLRGDDAAAVQLSERGLAASAAVRDAAYLYPFLVTGCRAHLALGDPGAAEHWVEDVGARVADRAIPGTLPAIDHGRGLVLLAQGSTGKARASLEAAVAGWQARDRRWEGTWAAIDLARCMARSNQRLEAGRLAAAARDDATKLGSPPLIAAAEEVLGLAGRRGMPADPWAPLTAREYEVARLVAEGMTNPSIAAALDVAPKTVAAHVEHILAKLGVGRRAEIAAWAASIAVLHSRPHGDDREE